MSAFQAVRQWMASSTVFHVAFGFVLMGGWAMFANHDHTLPEMLRAGLVQGAISGTLTLFLKKGLERMNALFAPANDDERQPEPVEGEKRGAALRQAQRDAISGAGMQRQPEPVEGEKRGAALRQAQRDAISGAGMQRQPEPVEGVGRNLAALAVPPLITAASILTILFTAHTLAGTPEIAATIAVPFAVSTTYAILYNLRLWRAAHGR